MNHLTLGIYANGEWKYNVVRDEDLETHIEYNKFWRFGRLLYVDGERVYDGYSQTRSNLEKYDKIAKDFYENIGRGINMDKPTIPYR